MSAEHSAEHPAVIYLKKVASLSDSALDRHLPPATDRPHKLHEAMRYSMFAGGKRLRPGLAYAAWEVFGGSGDDIFYGTSALEMLHTFSLIHDDLPCMDDDDFRRGRPTCHKAYNEATAVLAGDALCIHAFELLAKTGKAEAIATLAHALGTYGMIGGQIIDIESEGQKVDLDTVNYIHHHKTAALIEASMLIGSQIAGASPAEQAILKEFGRLIGLAFQVVDDILDIESTTEQLGKDAGSDLEKGKATYPSILGLDESKKCARKLYEDSLLVLEHLNHRETKALRDIAEYIIIRVH